MGAQCSKMDDEAETIAGMTLEEAREWRLAFLHLQGRAGMPMSAVPLANLLRKGKVPALVAATLADFLDGRNGAYPVALKPERNGKHTPRMTKARNAASRVRIGDEIMQDLAAGMALEQAIKKRLGSCSRSYLMDCYAAARHHCKMRVGVRAVLKNDAY